MAVKSSYDGAKLVAGVRLGKFNGTKRSYKKFNRALFGFYCGPLAINKLKD